MDTAQITRTEGLRTEAVHQRSGQRIITDAPPDNKGLGEAFSPTDLLSTSLPCCMMTTMAIVAQEKGISLKGMSARVIKHMAALPRRVARVEVYLEVDGKDLDLGERALMENTARTCPVAQSLHPDLVQELVITFH